MLIVIFLKEERIQEVSIIVDTCNTLNPALTNKDKKNKRGI